MKLTNLYLLLMLLISQQVLSQNIKQKVINVDICIYGGISGSVIAAYTAKKAGKSVLLVEPGKHLGGMTTGGLGFTDIGNKYAITALSRDFYRRIGQHYGEFEKWTFEPHVAETLMNDYVKRANINVLYNSRIVSAKKAGTKIIEIMLENSNKPSKATNTIVKAKMVKDNQEDLKTQIEKVFMLNTAKETAITLDAGHGRIEKRSCEVINNLTFLDGSQDWKGLKTIAKVLSERIDKKRGKQSEQTRYYISSLPAEPHAIAKAIRSHWSIENNLHWSLDVIFKEDSSLKKKGNSALNYTIVAKMALSILEKDTKSKTSKTQKRIKAALDDEFRSRLLAC
ncbi:MAG: ISAs1 family transposase [Pyrinomonadaceae bacterium]|nr:ISAs1 family transposase [Sphingobacteriaceae bacterium]